MFILKKKKKKKKKKKNKRSKREKRRGYFWSMNDSSLEGHQIGQV